MKFNRDKLAKDIILKRVYKERISLREAAKECGISFAMMSRYERQEFEPRIGHLISICEWLGTNINNYII